MKQHHKHAPRLLSLALAALLACALLPAAAVAQEADTPIVANGGTPTTFDALKTAIAGANSGDTVTLGGDITATDILTISNPKRITLDLHGQTLDMGGHFVEVTGGSANLNVKDSSNTGGKITGKAGTGTIRLSSLGTVNIYGGTVETTTLNGYAIYNNSTGTIYIPGGTVSATNGGSAIYSYDIASINITGGTVSATGGGNAIYNNSTGKIYISGGTVQATGGSGHAIYNQDTGKITISDSAKVTSDNASEEKPGTLYLDKIPSSPPPKKSFLTYRAARYQTQPQQTINTRFILPQLRLR